MRMKRYLIAAGLVGFVMGVGACLDSSGDLLLAEGGGRGGALDVVYPYAKIKELIKGKAFDEPSGIVFHARRGTFFVVGDEGMIGEFSLKGKQIRVKEFSDEPDFEGVTVDPSSGLLYVAHEVADRILEIDPETFKVLRVFDVPRRFEGEVVMDAGGDGIEGITFVPLKDHEQGGVFLYL